MPSLSVVAIVILVHVKLDEYWQNAAIVCAVYSSKYTFGSSVQRQSNLERAASCTFYP